MSLKTVTVPNRQNVGWRNSTAFADTVKKLKAENVLVVKGEEARKRIVKTVDTFVAKLNRNEKAEARKALCKTAGIVLRTFERWKAEGEQREEIGASLWEKAEELDYAITASSIRSLAEVKRLNPGKPPEDIVRKAIAASRPINEPKVERTPLDTRESLVQALNEHLEATQGDIESVLKVLRNSPIPREKLCKMCKDSADGK